MDVKEYRFMCKEIGLLEEYITSLKNMLEQFESQSLIKGQELTGMPFLSGGTRDKVGDLAIKIADTKKSIEDRQQELIMKKTEIILYVNSIQDSQIRQIVILKDIEGMSWRQVAQAIGNSTSPESVRKAYKRFMRKESDGE